jgi:hypothetical protein
MELFLTPFEHLAERLTGPVEARSDSSGRLFENGRHFFVIESFEILENQEHAVFIGQLIECILQVDLRLTPALDDCGAEGGVVLRELFTSAASSGFRSIRMRTR